MAHQIRQSLGPLSNDYRLAARIGDVANNDVLSSLQGHPGADPYAAIIMGDRALGTELSARELANAKGSLRLQANQALQGAVNDVANVRSNYQSLAGKIRSQLSGLTADQAKYVALNAPKIEQQMAADARAAQSAADAHRAARDLHNQRSRPKPLGPDASKMLGLGVLGSSPVQKAIRGIHVPAPVHHLPLTPDQKGSALSQINRAVEVLREAKPQDRLKVANHMLTGGYGSQKAGGIPTIGNAGPIPNTVLVQSALDLSRHGKLSGASYRALYGVPVPHEWRPYTPRQLRTLGVGAGAFLAGARRAGYR